jgi:hypothetical protein
MAKIAGPLFSIAASGSVGNVTFSASQAGASPIAGQSSKTHIARSKPRPSSWPASSDQLAMRSKCRSAAAAWQSLSALDKSKWTALGYTTHRAGQGATPINCKNGWPKFLQEYIIQHVVSPSTPLLPASYG